LILATLDINGLLYMRVACVQFTEKINQG